jgi:hypothetical protein
VPSAAALANGADSTPTVRQLSSSCAIAAVVGRGATDSTVEVRLPNGTLDVTPVDFPKDWQFLAGDLLYVDLKRGEALPHLTYGEVRSPNSGRPEPGWIAVNEDPELNRTMATVEEKGRTATDPAATQ